MQYTLSLVCPGCHVCFHRLITTETALPRLHWSRWLLVYMHMCPIPDGKQAEERVVSVQHDRPGTDDAVPPAAHGNAVAGMQPLSSRSITAKVEQFRARQGVNYTIRWRLSAYTRRPQLWTPGRAPGPSVYCWSCSPLFLSDRTTCTSCGRC